MRPSTALLVLACSVATLACTLMVCIILFQTNGGYGAMPTNEFDGDPASVILECDPCA